MLRAPRTWGYPETPVTDPTQRHAGGSTVDPGCLAASAASSGSLRSASTSNTSRSAAVGPQGAASHAALGPGLAGVTLPTRIGRFTVLEPLGSGGMGLVCAAYDSELDRKVAIKLLRPQNGTAGKIALAQARLLREAQAMARLAHPNVVTIHEVGTHGDQVFIAMEFLLGMTLKRWLRRVRRPWQEVLAVFLQAGRGLAVAHAAGLIHRDFKPKSRRPSQTAPQPTDRPHSHSQGRFERVDVYRAAPGRSGVPQVLAKRWQRAGPLEDQRGHAPRHSQGRHHEPFPSHPFATAAPRAAAGR